MKKLFLLPILALVAALVYPVYAASVASLVVEVPTTIGVNQAVDLTVKAVDASGSPVKDYSSIIYMEATVDAYDDVVFPSDGVYEFTAQDQ